MHKFKCFLINLDKDQDRLTFMNLELKRIGLEYSRQPAVYGKMLTEKEVSALYDYEYSGNNNLGNMNLGEIGCALSHRSVYEKIIREDIDYTLVLEDDVLLPDNFKEVVGEVISLNQASDSWDYLSFDYYAYGFSFVKLWVPGVLKILKSKDTLLRKIVFSLAILSKSPFVMCVSFHEEIQKLFFKNNPVTPIRPIYFAGAYIVTKAGAKKLLSVHDKIIYIADRLPNVAIKERGLRFKIYTPLVVRQLKERFVSNLSN